MADTGSYFVAAYTITGLMYAGYAASIWWRRRALAERRARLAPAGPRAGEPVRRA